MSDTEIIQMIGTRLKQYRLNAGVTQKEMAENCGMSLPTIQKLESGTTTNINMSNLLKILRFLGILENINYFIPEQPQSPYAKKNIQRIRHGRQEK